MTQCEWILDYLKRFGSITSYEAYTDLGITQLGARIDNLQKEGYVFKKKTIVKKNKFGKTTRFKEYSLEEK